jgi:D-alanyl-D-alanine carboxypeptidase
MSLVKTQSEFALDVARLITYATSEGFMVTGGELYRTKAQQEIYVKAGLSKTMDSQHIKRLAIDINLLDSHGGLCAASQYAPIGAYWQSLNSANRWGGNFKNFADANHFERLEK